LFPGSQRCRFYCHTLVYAALVPPLRYLVRLPFTHTRTHAPLLRTAGSLHTRFTALLRWFTHARTFTLTWHLVPTVHWFTHMPCHTFNTTARTTHALFHTPHRCAPRPTRTRLLRFATGYCTRFAFTARAAHAHTAPVYRLCRTRALRIRAAFGFTATPHYTLHTWFLYHTHATHATATVYTAHTYTRRACLPFGYAHYARVYRACRAFTHCVYVYYYFTRSFTHILHHTAFIWFPHTTHRFYTTRFTTGWFTRMVYTRRFTVYTVYGLPPLRFYTVYILRLRFGSRLGLHTYTRLRFTALWFGYRFGCLVCLVHLVAVAAHTHTRYTLGSGSLPRTRLPHAFTVYGCLPRGLRLRIGYGLPAGPRLGLFPLVVLHTVYLPHTFTHPHHIAFTQFTFAVWDTFWFTRFGFTHTFVLVAHYPAYLPHTFLSGLQFGCLVWLPLHTVPRFTPVVALVVYFGCYVACYAHNTHYACRAFGWTRTRTVTGLRVLLWLLLPRSTTADATPLVTFGCVLDFAHFAYTLAHCRTAHARGSAAWVGYLPHRATHAPLQVLRSFAEHHTHTHAAVLRYTTGLLALLHAPPHGLRTLRVCAAHARVTAHTTARVTQVYTVYTFGSVGLRTRTRLRRTPHLPAPTPHTHTHHTHTHTHTHTHHPTRVYTPHTTHTHTHTRVATTPTHYTGSVCARLPRGFTTPRTHAHTAHAHFWFSFTGYGLRSLLVRLRCAIALVRLHTHALRYHVATHHAVLLLYVHTPHRFTRLHTPHPTHTGLPTQVCPFGFTHTHTHTRFTRWFTLHIHVTVHWVTQHYTHTHHTHTHTHHTHTLPTHTPLHTPHTHTRFRTHTHTHSSLHLHTHTEGYGSWTFIYGHS